ncbi:CUN042 hypothetical protein [Culex nigripalpus nucleopolyhedrovirus]|uniref:Uncharacterized protein n=1 Tax=Culex nigripalpus nucleopolyhedrovirus (isolate Florida/1997) TaxID=645993 RepID=Q919M8_NPVCO|nr:CUN042 hypothetical protein [Culex nigripalpus nucleopolyhedrovirus]AAK94120.1 CUN042 hypothetical protein [Culex nigripalpus nucleopolyhedrovirus]
MVRRFSAPTCTNVPEKLYMFAVKFSYSLKYRTINRFTLTNRSSIHTMLYSVEVRVFSTEIPSQSLHHSHHIAIPFDKDRWTVDGILPDDIPLDHTIRLCVTVRGSKKFSCVWRETTYKCGNVYDPPLEYQLEKLPGVQYSDLALRIIEKFERAMKYTIEVDFTANKSQSLEL